MAQIKNFGLIGVGSQVQFGKAGPQLVNNSGVFAFRNAGNTADANITAGNLTLSGNLQVNGTTTTVNATSITTADQTIILSNGSTTDAMASGAGIIVQGATQHSILFDNTNSAFTTTENFNLVTGKQYEINGVAVLSATTLGSSVTSSSLTSLGNLTSLTVTGTSNLEGAVTAGSTLAVTGNTTVGGTLGVTGATTLAGLTAGATTVTGGLSTDTMTTTGNVTVGGTLGVTGATTLAGLTASSVLVSGLAGTGTRTLAVDSNGNLVTSGASGTFSGSAATVGDIYISGDTITTLANSPLVLTSEANAVSVGTSGTPATLTVTGGLTAASVSTTEFKTTQLATPGVATGVGSTTGGTLAAATYYVKIAAVDAFGNTTPVGPESTGVTTTGTTSSIAYTWTAVPGAVSYDVWYGTATGVETAYYSASSNSFTLTATSGTAGTAPTVNTTGTAAVAGPLTVAGSTTLAGLSAGTSSLGATTVTGGLTTDTAKVSGLTAGDLVFAGTGGLLSTNSALSFNSTTGAVTATGALSAGSISTTGTLAAGASTLGATTVTGGLSTDTLTTTGNASVGGTLTVTGASTLAALTATGITDSGLTATQVVFAGTGGLLSGNSALTFNSSTGVLTATEFTTGTVIMNATTVTGLATPVNGSDAANKTYVDNAVSSAVGTAAVDTAHGAHVAFAYNSSSPVQIASSVTGFVHRIKVYITTAFTDATATVTVNAVTAGALTVASDVDPSGVACYVIELAQAVSSDTLQVAITPGTSTAGAGHVVVEWL